MRLRAGFIPLVDSAVLVAAADHGFAAAEGLDLELVREVSWSNIRDKLKLGHFEAAHMLSPLAISETLGLDYPAVPLSALMVLNQNGNSIVLGGETHSALAALAEGDLDDPAVSGAALKALVASRAGRGEDKLSFAMTFPFSTHNYLLRFWMAAAGIDPDRDVRLVVLPPSYMADALADGQIHGFCAGAPWPGLAVDSGTGSIVHLGTDIFSSVTEKVLAVRSAWLSEEPEAAKALIRALLRACSWCSTAENRLELAHILSAPARLDLPPEIILRTLDGRLRVDGAGRVRGDTRYLVIDPAIARPDRDQALWLYAQMVRWRQAELADSHRAAISACFSPMPFEEALASLTRREIQGDGIGAFSGPAFTPGDIGAYLQALEASSAPCGAD